jgi:hypothetical protein
MIDLEGPTARRERRARARGFRPLVDQGPDPKAETGCKALLTALRRDWGGKPHLSRVFVAVVPAKGSPVDWLLHGISIRHALTLPSKDTRMIVLRDEDEQQEAFGVHAGAELLTSTYILPRSPMVKVGKLMRSWDLNRPLITIVDSLCGIMPPKKVWADGPDCRNWWTMGKHLVTMLNVMQHSIDLQPFPQPLALVVMLRDTTYNGLSDEYRDAMRAMFPVVHAR